MRRVHWFLLWTFGLPTLLIVVFYFVVLDTGFSTSTMHTDTGIGPVPAKPDTITYLEKPMGVTLVLVCGGRPNRRFSRTPTGGRKGDSKPPLGQWMLRHADETIKCVDSIQQMTGARAAEKRVDCSVR